MRVAGIRRLRLITATSTLVCVLGVAGFGAAPAVADPQPPPSGSASSGQPNPNPDGKKQDTNPQDKWGPPPPMQPPESFPRPVWPPPPVDMRANRPAQPPKPDATYKLQRQCIQSGVFGELYQPQPWAQKALQLNQVHKIAQGKNEMLGIIDTGVHRNRFFQNRLVPGGDYVQAGKDGLTDCDGHGTEVAGVMAANTHPNDANKNVGFDGMAPQAKVVSVRTNSTNFAYKGKYQGKQVDLHAGNLHTLGLAIDHLVDTFPHLAAINISLTACRPIDQQVSGWYHFLQAAIHHAVAERGVVVVVAAGNMSKSENSGCTKNNDSPDPSKIESVPIPAWFGNDVLTVAAVNQQGDPATFSVAGPWVDVAAPGTDIVSLDPAGNGIVNRSIENDVSVAASSNGGGSSDGAVAGQQPVPIQGTSFAAPYVTGLVALVRQKFPYLDAYQVMHRIEATAQHPAGPSGRNDYVGYGMIDPMAALTAIVPGEPGPNGQQGAPVAKAQQLPPNLPVPATRNWTAVTVALVGTGGGLGLLVVTLFVVHTVRRNRRRRRRPASTA